jgi:hypothetical protein
MTILWGNGSKPWTGWTRKDARTYAQFDLAALVSVPDIDETMTNALASVECHLKSVASRELATITSDYPTDNIFYTDWSMISDIAGFAVYTRGQKKRWWKFSLFHHLFFSGFECKTEIMIRASTGENI